MFAVCPQILLLALLLLEFRIIGLKKQLSKIDNSSLNTNS